MAAGAHWKPPDHKGHMQPPTRTLQPFMLGKPFQSFMLDKPFQPLTSTVTATAKATATSMFGFHLHPSTFHLSASPTHFYFSSPPDSDSRLQPAALNPRQSPATSAARQSPRRRCASPFAAAGWSVRAPARAAVPTPAGPGTAGQTPARTRGGAARVAAAARQHVEAVHAAVDVLASHHLCAAERLESVKWWGVGGSEAVHAAADALANHRLCAAQLGGKCDEHDSASWRADSDLKTMNKVDGQVLKLAGHLRLAHAICSVRPPAGGRVLVCGNYVHPKGVDVKQSARRRQRHQLQVDARVAQLACTLHRGGPAHGCGCERVWTHSWTGRVSAP
eukprot:351138-Chlamydomonas_euryale.AAC.3